MPLCPWERKKYRPWIRSRTGSSGMKGNLYKKSYTHLLLKCVTFDRNYILWEIHKGACSSHQGARTTAEKALRIRYYWPTLKEDAMELVKKFPDYQLHRDIPHAPTNPSATIQAILPFDKSGMDLIGPFHAARGHKRFLLVAIEYFTKWVEVEPLASITDKQVQNFIW